MLLRGVNQDGEVQEGKRFISIRCKSCQGPENLEHWVTHLVAGGCPSWAVDHIVCTQSAAAFLYSKCARASVRCDKASVTNPVQSGGNPLPLTPPHPLPPTSSLAECLMQRTSAELCTGGGLWESLFSQSPGALRGLVLSCQDSPQILKAQLSINLTQISLGGIWVNLLKCGLSIYWLSHSGIHRLYLPHVSPTRPVSGWKI